jgi:hypothetical protein
MDISLIVILSVAGALVVAGIIMFIRSRKAAAARNEPYYHFVCTGCRRKLRYRARQAGHSGMCPRCSRPCTFPAIEKK